MTPFGRRVRELREAKGVTQRDMAFAMGVSPAWISALENGRRGRPSWEFVQRVISYFNVIWDDADELLELAHISHPRAVVDTSGLSPEATELANLLADQIGRLEPQEIATILELLRARAARPAGRAHSSATSGSSS